MSSIAFSRSWLRDLFLIIWAEVTLLRFKTRRPRTATASSSFISPFCCALTMSSQLRTLAVPTTVALIDVPRTSGLILLLEE